MKVGVIKYCCTLTNFFSNIKRTIVNIVKNAEEIFKTLFSWLV